MNRQQKEIKISQHNTIINREIPKQSTDAIRKVQTNINHASKTVRSYLTIKNQENNFDRDIANNWLHHMIRLTQLPKLEG